MSNAYLQIEVLDQKENNILGTIPKFPVPKFCHYQKNFENKNVFGLKVIEKIFWAGFRHNLNSPLIVNVTFGYWF